MFFIQPAVSRLPSWNVLYKNLSLSVKGNLCKYLNIFGSILLLS